MFERPSVKTGDNCTAFQQPSTFVAFVALVPVRIWPGNTAHYTQHTTLHYVTDSPVCGVCHPHVMMPYNAAMLGSSRVSHVGTCHPRKLALAAERVDY